MDGGNEQRVAIKFCFKAGLSATEIVVLVQTAYGNEALNRSNVFWWYSRFLEGRELVEDDEEGGRAKSTRNEVNIAVVAGMVKKLPSNRIKNDSRIFEHPKNCSSSDSEKDLGKRKLCASFVPHPLTPEHREDRVTSCQDIIAMADADKNFLTKLLREMRHGVLPMTTKQSDRVLKGLVRHPLDRRN
jgi:hypothetical protein